MSSAESTPAPQPEEQPDTKAGDPEVVWKPAIRIAFRFAFAYFAMYAFPLALGWIPILDYLAGRWEEMWRKIVPWIAAHVLHLANPITFFPTGSGDTTYNYVRVLCLLVIAVTITVVWSVLDRKRRSYVKLNQWLRLGVRLALGTMLISYGLQKVIPLQFTPPDYFRLLERYGDSSPMGLLWTFIGASPAYTIFTGCVELTGGVLIILPGLTTLGALVSLAAVTNVFVLNMCYDVPVKLLSLHLLVMALFLLLPDLPRLTGVLVLNRDTPARKDIPFFSRRGLNIAVAALQVTFAGYVAISCLLVFHQQYKDRVVTRPPFYGIWAVDEFSVDGAARPPLMTDQLRWQRVVFAIPTLFSVQRMDGTIQHYRFTIDNDKKIFLLTRSADPNWKTALTFNTLPGDTMILDGTLDGHELHIKTHLDDPKFLLTTRGFHWITERSFNR